MAHLASDIGVECRRIEISREELYTSDELFLCGTAAGITPIRGVNERKVGDGSWPITRRLQVVPEDVVRGRDRRYEHWLDYVG